MVIFLNKETTYNDCTNNRGHSPLSGSENTLISRSDCTGVICSCRSSWLFLLPSSGVREWRHLLDIEQCGMVITGKAMSMYVTNAVDTVMWQVTHRVSLTYLSIYPL